jgi:translation initiation factor 2 alpha subunit (eIF-2alpha)
MHESVNEDSSMAILQQYEGIKIVVFWDEVLCNWVNRIIRNVDIY